MITFPFDLDIPANTLVTDLFNEEVELTIGTIVEIKITIPWGVAGLAGVRFQRLEYPVLPIVRDTWITGNESVLVFPLSYQLNELPLKLTIYGYNDDSYYSHIISGFISMEESLQNLEKVVDNFGSLTELAKRFKKYGEQTE